jgi:hypothetical protein
MYWPSQDATDFTPTAYPWAIQMYGSNGCVKNVGLVNAYKGLYLRTVNRPLVADVSGQVIDTGVEIDGLVDCGTIERIILAPIWGFFWGGASSYSRANFYFFKIYRCDEVHISDSSNFWGYVGFLLQTGSLGTINGVDYNGPSIGTATNVIIDTADFGVIIYDINDAIGWTFTGCKFGVASHGVIDVGAATHGPAAFVGCQFWGGYDGACNYVCAVDGTATYQFVGCFFNQYTLSPFTPAGSSRVIITGCDFGVSIGDDVTTAASGSVIAVGNFVKGGFTANTGGGGAVSSNNNVSY